MSKFTKGSWIFDDEYIFTANKGWMIADVMAVRNQDEFNANVRLIASAPELYEILNDLCLSYMKFHYYTLYRDDNRSTIIEEVCVKENIAKAKKILAWIDGEEIKHD